LDRNIKRNLLSGMALGSIGVLVLAGCAATSSDNEPTAGSAEDAVTTDPITITVGTTDKVTTIDPAGSYDSGSFAVMNQVYPFLMNSTPGNAEMIPDIAVSAGYTSELEYTVVLKPDLKFANGNDLTASDVKFSFDRQV